MVRGKTWAGVAGLASVLCGLMVAAAVGGAPPWAGEATVGVLVAAAVFVLATGAWERRRTRQPHSPTHLALSLDAVRAHDLKIVSEVLAIVKPNDVKWIRKETFVVPWRGARVTPFRVLADTDKRLDLPLDADVGATVRAMVDAVEAFLRLYDATTSPDSLIFAGDWQEVHGAQRAERGGIDREAFDKRCEQLRTKAHAVALAYDRLRVRAR